MDKYHLFLEKLRRSGKTNMFGAVPYLMIEFGLNKDEAIKILAEWMRTYDPKEYEEVIDNG